MPASLSTWSIAAIKDGRVVVTLRGDLDLAEADALEAEFRRRFAAITPGSIEALFDLDELSRCTVDARAVLLRLQRFLGRVARRTAYVANRPLFRGLGLWICHQAPDSNARTFSSAVQAEAWLGETTRRDVDLAAQAARWFARIERKEARA